VVAMGRGALALLAVIAALGVPCASAAACINQDAGSELWDGVCLYIEQQPNPRAMCDEIIRVDGLPPDMCCVCGISFGDLQKAAGQPPNSWTEIPLPLVPDWYNDRFRMQHVSARRWHRVTAARGLVYVYGGQGKGEAPRPHLTCLQVLCACLTQCRCDAQTT
jgi:hypothetical protein